MKDFYSTTQVNTGQASNNKQGQNMDFMSYINQGQKGLQNQLNNKMFSNKKNTL